MFPSWIPEPGVKNHWIPDLDPAVICNLTHLKEGDTRVKFMFRILEKKHVESETIWIRIRKKSFWIDNNVFKVKCCRASLEEVPFAKEFEFRAENYSMELAEKEICRTLK